MTKRTTQPKKLTPAQLYAAIVALQDQLKGAPVRSAEWKGRQIILHTRSGDYAHTPPS